MILSPDINQPIMSARELLHDVSQVRTEVGVCATRLADHAIFIVTKRRALEPECTLALFKPVSFTELANRAINEPFGVERTL